ncbi:MAG: tubulin-like doman-containing protein [Lachnospiraceae bacterium]|nr:tubulin-like doman-containing protein [Lachnospiraceae bacterium]
MALEKIQKDRLDKLDFGKGGGFSGFITNRTKLEPSDSKFLFIGLGGKGSSVVAGIKTEVYKKIQCPMDAFRPDSFEYLVVDTDKDNLEKLTQGGFGEIGLSAAPQDSESCQLYDGNAAKILEMKHNLPENIREWISPTLNAKLTGNGAKAVRQAGRYLLFGNGAFLRLHNSLTVKLTSLHNQITNSARQKLIVYIFAGIGGGTGSGTIIDVPYIVRKICADKGWDVKIYSYIFLPDTYAKNTDQIWYNSYAALKEIDVLMNLEYMDGAGHFHAVYAPGFVVDTNKQIFDSCVLVSGKRSDGEVRDPDTFSRRVVVDNIINLVSKSETRGEVLANSFLDNSPTMIYDKVGQLGDKVPRNAYYQYLAVGIGAVVLPMEQILAYLAHGVMDKLTEAWDKHAQDRHVQTFLGDLHMLPEEICSNIVNKSPIPLFQYSDDLKAKAKGKDIADGTLYQRIKGIWMGYRVQMLNAWDNAKQQCLEEITSSLSRNYKNMFSHPDYGIYFLKELISFRVKDGNNINGVRERLKTDYMNSVRDMVNGEQERQQMLDREMADVSGFRRVEKYCRLCVERLVSEDIELMYRTHVTQCIEEILKFIEVRSQELQNYIDIFTYMKDIVDRNYGTAMKGELPHAEYASVLLDFSRRISDPATDAVLRFLDDMLKKKTKEGLVTGLEERIMETQVFWLYSDEKFNPLQVFVQFLENQFEEVPDLTIEKFLKLKYGNDFGEGMNAICEELSNSADVIFPSIPLLDLHSLASNRYVVVPAGDFEVSKSIKAYANFNGVTVAESVDMNSVYWYNLVVGIPLFALTDISDYEEKYERNVAQSENNGADQRTSALKPKTGIHLWESDKANWRNLPNLFNREIWPIADFNIREKKRIDKVAEDTKRFLEAGLICRNVDTELYEAYCIQEGNSGYNADSVLQWCGEQYLKEPVYREDGLVEDGRAFIEQMRTVKKFECFQVQLATILFRLNEDNLYKAIYMNPFLYGKLCATYTVYESCKELISKANADKAEQMRVRDGLERFFGYVRTGILVLGDDVVFLRDEKGEEIALFYMEDHSSLEREFSLYYIFHIFLKKFSWEELSELDRYQEALTDDHSDAAREKYRANRDDFQEKAVAARESLKKLDTKKRLEKAGKAGMIEELVEFYEKLLIMF